MLQYVTNCYNVRAIWSSEVRNAAFNGRGRIRPDCLGPRPSRCIPGPLRPSMAPTSTVSGDDEYNTDDARLQLAVRSLNILEHR
jgi:hypothetical protein